MTTGPHQVTVLYVGGTGRSGSTVLANVLGEAPGHVSVGEVRFLWQRGILEDRLCGCGEPFSGCAFWADVLDRALGPGTPRSRAALAARLHAALERRTRLRTLPAHLRDRTGQHLFPATPVPELDEVLGRLYVAIAETAGASVVVDSSKLPTYAAFVAGLPSLDLRVVHLVRDPRAAAYSWRRRKPQPDRGPDAMMERRGAVKSSVLWVTWNRGLERLFDGRPYTRVSYEEFLDDPPATAARVLADLGLRDTLEGVFVDRGTVRLSGAHTVAGNPARHTTGLVPLVPDSEWRAAMSQADRRAVVALTWPTLTRYGYPLRG